ncbi:Calcipressin-domain-containing protein [Durotheca rogersii]|uniref:Calcipressin-domain-containing protein n=1 Tax=Durotheca rogersii TaxID=419775 RepID=UPI002220BF79|nr:Calcipressin-domain-containing protein [Durotheca rogersii]KAI5863469.1 Calcipressin-domain-containing protein [Durotheca rogersii]
MSGTQSPTSSTSPSLMARRGSSRSLSLDLSSLPPLTQPTPPTNTLLITNLGDAEIFRPDNLQTIRDLISATEPIYTWSPLKSFSRIIVSFLDEQAAIRVRAIWDGKVIMGERCRVYFGQATSLDLHKDNHLELPDAGKLFFISPPPSPPHGWEMKLEDAPNKQVHAEDLAEALAKLRHQAAPVGVADASPVSPVSGDFAMTARTTRSRSSTLIYHPHEHGGSPNLPAISVDDMTDDSLDIEPTPERPIMAHTSRPPVELME